MSASLYGIENSNRNFADPYYWGKNQFNSSFPIALTCYMRDQGLSPVRQLFAQLQTGGGAAGL